METPTHPGFFRNSTGLPSRWPRFLQFLKRLWWLPVLTLALALAAASFYTLLQRPSYMSSARMWVSGKLRLEENSYYSEELQFFFGTQVELLQSEKLQQAAQARVQTMTPNLAPCSVNLRIIQAPKSAMFLLYAAGEGPAYTQAYLNALIDEYLIYKKQVRAGTSDETLTSLSEQVYQHEKDLQSEQEKLTLYQRDNNVAVLQDQGTAAGAYLAKLNAQLSDLKLESQFLGALLSEFCPNAAGSNLLTAISSDALNSPGLAGPVQTAELATAFQHLQLLRLQREDLIPFLRPHHPKMQRANEEIVRAEKLFALLQQQSRDQLESSRQARQLKIEAIQNSIDEWERKLVEANQRIAEFDRLKGNVQRLQSIHDKLLNVLQSLDINKSLDQEVVSVMERASIARPAKANLRKTLSMASLGGIAGGLMLVFFLTRLDDRFTSIHELIEQFDEEIVGQVPDVRRTRRNGKLQLVEPDDERHMFAESYRGIRSSVFFMPSDSTPPKMMLVTSAIPNEGKSTVSANLARTIAFAGGRVLLIDGDMRRGKLHEYFGVQRGAGLSRLLHEPGKIDDFIVPTSLPNLFLMTNGEPISNVSECFLSAEFDRFLHEARAQFEHIIIDSAPVFAADDAPTLAPKMDGVLFVVRSSFTRAAMARQALDILYQRQARILGLVFNRANTKAEAYYYDKEPDNYGSTTKTNASRPSDPVHNENPRTVP